MSKYLTTKKGSLEDMVAGVTEGKQSEDYKQLFKKELEKTGKGIGSMSDMEKKSFFNKIDKKHSAKNEGSKEVQQKNVRTSPGEGTGAAGGPKLSESVELEEGGVKDFLMDVEDDASDMSLNDLIKKYYGQMGLSAQEIKKIYYRVNEELTAGQKKLPPALQKAIKDKEDKKEVKEESEEETKSLKDTVHDIWNQAAKEEETREDEAKYYKPVEEEKKSLNEEKIKCPNCGHMNDADAHKCSNCGASLKSEEKDGKKKAMTGSPASKVDTTPEVEYEH